MARLIDADKFGMYLADVQLANRGCRADVCEFLDDVMYALEEAPTIDAVEVVRCKDCKYSCNPIPEDVGFVECLYCSDPRREPGEEMAIVGYDDFCSYGERKEE